MLYELSQVFPLVVLDWVIESCRTTFNSNNLPLIAILAALSDYFFTKGFPFINRTLWPPSF